MTIQIYHKPAKGVDVQNLVEIDSAVMNVRMCEKTRFRVDFFVDITSYPSIYLFRFSSGLQVIFLGRF